VTNFIPVVTMLWWGQGYQMLNISIQPCVLSSQHSYHLVGQNVLMGALKFQKNMLLEHAYKMSGNIYLFWQLTAIVNN
jgi:hypothetical protein